MQSLAQFINTIINIYIWILLIQVIMSWLISFRIVNMGNQFVRMVYDVSYRLTEPLLRPIRRIIPHLGGIDISPVILILLIQLLRNLLFEYVF